MKSSDVKISPFNPRKMTKEARSALKKSLEEFSDISGITINSKTGNVVSGNHRWEELLEKYKKLELQKVFEDRHAIMSNGKYTGFMARVVEWSLKKEKQANVTANSSLVSGEWSSDLQELLHDISLETDQLLLDELRISEMMVDLSVSDADLDLVKDTRQEKTQEKEDEYELKDDEKSNSEVREIISTIKITLPSEYKEEVEGIILKALSKLEYYEQTSIH